MRLLANDGTAYRACVAGDEIAMHRALIGEVSYADLIASVSSPVDADVDIDYGGLSEDSRVFVVDDGIVRGFVKVVLSEDGRWTATIESRVIPGKADHDMAIVYAGDVMVWLAHLGVQAANVKMHLDGGVREFDSDPLDTGILGLTRDVTYER